jgi:hypothetical protein
MSLANELEKLAGELGGNTPMERIWSYAAFGSTMERLLPTILSALREREAAQALAKFAAGMEPLGAEFTAALGSVEDLYEDDAGEHMKGEG